MKTQKENNTETPKGRQAGAKEKGLRRMQYCQHPGLDLIASRIVKKIILFHANTPIVEPYDVAQLENQYVVKSSIDLINY